MCVCEKYCSFVCTYICSIYWVCLLMYLSLLCIFMCLAVLGLMSPCIQSISLCVYLLKYWSILSACLFTIYFPSMIYSKNSFLSDMHIYISMNLSLVHSPSCHFFHPTIYLPICPSIIYSWPRFWDGLLHKEDLLCAICDTAPWLATSWCGDKGWDSKYIWYSEWEIKNETSGKDPK